MRNQFFLKKQSENLAKKIISAKSNKTFSNRPFKHLYIDNAFSKNIANDCLKNFPSETSKNWIKTNDKDIEIKYRSNWQSEFDIPEGIIDVIRVLNSSLILKAISNAFNIKKIIPDPYYTGGGLNMSTKNGKLDVHVDGNYHDASGLNRRINVILFLNKKWQKNWLGEFGLYNSTGTICEKKIEPLFNRLIIFDTHDFSYHGLPDPINFPKKHPRRSVILYYYTKESRPKDKTKFLKPHSALWVKKNYKDKKGKYTRKFN